MSAIQRARSGVPLDRRSTFPTVPGLPWWGVVCLAVGLTCVGFVVDTARGSELSSVFSTLYVLGCVLAVVFASNRAVFTAMVQPPLILFVGVPLAQMVVSDESSTALRDLAINVAYPLIDRFPVMLTATVLTALVGGLRLLLLSQRRAGPARSHDRARVARSGAREKKAAARRAAPSAPDAERRRRRARPASGPAAAEEPHQKVRGRAPAPRRRTAAPDARPAPEPRATPRAQPGPPPQRRPETPAGRRVEARPEPAPMARPEPTAAPKASMPRRRRPAPEPGTMPRASMREDWNSPSQARRQEMPARPMPRVRYRDERPPREFDR